MILLLGVVALALAIWMYADAGSVAREKNLPRGPGGMSPGEWFLAGLLLWIVALPFYVVRRGEAKSGERLSSAEFDRVAAYQAQRGSPVGKAVELLSIAALVSIALAGAGFGLAMWRDYRERHATTDAATVAAAPAATPTPVPMVNSTNPEKRGLAARSQAEAFLAARGASPSLAEWYRSHGHARLVPLASALVDFLKVESGRPEDSLSKTRPAACEAIARAAIKAGGMRRSGDADLDAAALRLIDAAGVLVAACRSGQPALRVETQAVDAALRGLAQQIERKGLE